MTPEVEEVEKNGHDWNFFYHFVQGSVNLHGTKRIFRAVMFAIRGFFASIASERPSKIVQRS